MNDDFWILTFSGKKLYTSCTSKNLELLEIDWTENKRKYILHQMSLGKWECEAEWVQEGKWLTEVREGSLKITNLHVCPLWLKQVPCC